MVFELETGGLCWGSSEASVVPRLLRLKKMKIRMAPMITTPAIVPPIIAPTGVDDLGDGDGDWGVVLTALVGKADEDVAPEIVPPIIVPAGVDDLGGGDSDWGDVPTAPEGEADEGVADEGVVDEDVGVDSPGTSITKPSSVICDFPKRVSFRF